MKNALNIGVLALLLCLFSYAPKSAQAQDSATSSEIAELKKSIARLEKMVEQQNARIDQLTKNQNLLAKPNPENAAQPVPVPSYPTAEKPSENQIAAAPTTMPSSDSEVDTLLNKVNSAPPPPGENSRSVGLWKYPTGSSPAAKMLPDISVISSFAGSYFTQDPEFEVGVDPSRTGFTFQELEIGLQGVVDPYFRYDAFLSFAEEGVEIEEAYFTTLTPPKGLQFRGGKMRLPFGRQNPKHLHAWSFADNNLVTQAFLGADGLKELGVEISYLFPTPFFLQLQGTFTNGDTEPSFNSSQKGDFLYQGRLSTSFDLNPELTMLIGGSVAFGFNDTGPGNYTHLYGGDLLLKWKHSAYTSLSWQNEFILRDYETPEGVQADGGFYSYVDYQFLKRWHAGFRYDQMGIPSGEFAKEFRLTPAMTFNPTEFSQIRLQYEYNKTENLEAVQAVILQLMFSLGVHGAHLF